MSREAMQQALEALIPLANAASPNERECLTDEDHERAAEALETLRAALAEPENQSQSQTDTKVNPAEPAQKPVAWMCPDDPDRATAFAWNYGHCIDCGKPRIPLFTTRTGDSNE